MNIYVFNKSKGVADQVVLHAMVNAMDKQLVQAAKLWDRSPSHALLVDDLMSAPKESPVVVILDDADQADALGYHDQTPDGRPYGRVFASPTLKNGGTLITGPDSVSCTLSHELLELWADPNVNAWFDNAKEESFAFELCDPVEADSYEIKVHGYHPVSVSNFVLPPYFDSVPQATDVKFDYLGKLKAPFTMTAGGYLIKRVNGKVTNVFGKDYPEWKKPGKLHVAARTARRAA